jgi:hypothetical protein
MVSLAWSLLGQETSVDTTVCCFFPARNATKYDNIMFFPETFFKQKTEDTDAWVF